MFKKKKKKKKRKILQLYVPANTAKVSMDSKVVEQLLPPAGSPRSLILWVLGKGMRVKTIAKDLCKNSKFYFVFLSKIMKFKVSPKFYFLLLLTFRKNFNFNSNLKF